MSRGYIKVNNFKVENRLWGAVNTYKGNPSLFDFGRLASKYESLNKSLEQFDSGFSCIWYGEGNPKIMRFNLGKFMVVTDGGDFVWLFDTKYGRKVDKLYIDNRPIPVYKWLRMSDEKRKSFYNEKKSLRSSLSNIVGLATSQIYIDYGNTK